MDDWVVLAHLTRTRGNRGELCANALTDYPDRFRQLKQVYLNGKPYELESVWYHKEQPIFKFRGVDSIGDAEGLVGTDVCIPAAERVAPPEGEYFFSDLVGCRVLHDVSGGEVGVVTGWQETGGPVLLVVSDGSGEELLVPFATAILKKIDVEAREIRVELPPGLIELNR